MEISQEMWRKIVSQLIEKQENSSCDYNTLEFILSHFDDAERFTYEQQLLALFHHLEYIPKHYADAIMKSATSFIDLFELTDLNHLDESTEYRKQFGDSYFVLMHLEGFPGLLDGAFNQEVYGSWWNEVKNHYVHTERFGFLLSCLGDYLISLPLSDDDMLYPRIILDLLNHPAYKSLRDSYHMGLYNHNGGQLFSKVSIPERIQQCSILKNRFENSNPPYPIFASVFDDLRNTYKNSISDDRRSETIMDLIQSFKNQPMKNKEA